MRRTGGEMVRGRDDEPHADGEDDGADNRRDHESADRSHAGDPLPSVGSQPTPRLDAEAFAEHWPPVRARLLGRLVRQGVDEDAAEEICQRVALRAVRYGVALPEGTRLFDWAKRAAHQEATAIRQSVEPIDVSGLVWQDDDGPPGLTAFFDDPLPVDEEVVERASGYDLFATLTETDRAVLRDLATGRQLKTDRADQKRFAVQLYRLRERLAARAEELRNELDGLAILICVRVASLRCRIEQAMTTATAMAVTAAVGVTLTAAGLPWPERSEAARPVEVTTSLTSAVLRIEVANSPEPSPASSAPPSTWEPAQGDHPVEQPPRPPNDWPVPHRRLAVDQDGNGASVGTSPNSPDRPLVCLESGGVLRPQCVEKLRPPAAPAH